MFERTKRRRLTSALDSYEEDAIKVALDQMIEGIIIVDHDWRFVYLNEAAARHRHKQKSELIGSTMMECYPGIDQTSMFRDLRYVMQSRETRQIEDHFEYEDGSKTWFELYIEPAPDGLLIRSIDITAQKTLEEQFRLAQKQEAVGQLAGGLAHDFNNKLFVILACSELIQMRQGVDDSIRDYALKINAAVEDASVLTRHLLAIGRKLVLDVRVVNLNRLLEKGRTILQKLIGENIRTEYSLAEDLSNVRLDSGQFDHVILNLSINARDAMPGGGTLRFETTNVLLDEAFTLSHPNLTPGPHVMLAISDTGSGIPTEILEKIFDPFFTTKEKKGTGLGLAMVYGIVSQLKGHIWVYSEPGMGTVFKIYLPAVMEEVDEEEFVPIEGELLAGGQETILLVEDDDNLRDMMGETLRSVGYVVYSARDGEEADTLFEEHTDEISLALIDLVLPGIRGEEFYEQLRQRNPDLKVVFMSGFSREPTVGEDVPRKNYVLIQKPILITKLLGTIRGLLNSTLKKRVV